MPYAHRARAGSALDAGSTGSGIGVECGGNGKSSAGDDEEAKASVGGEERASGVSISPSLRTVPLPDFLGNANIATPTDSILVEKRFALIVRPQIPSQVYLGR